jgi:hypothetical protein
MMTSKEVYPSLVQMIINAETISWNRFYNFLMFNTILVLAWATVWVSKDASALKAVVLLAICSLGGISGIFWAALGYRGREFLDAYAKMAADLEVDSTAWATDIEKYKPLTKTIELRDSLCYGWAGSRVALIAGPLAFTVLYGIMFFVSLSRR